jgi:C-terminal processing protease CtpA/Prc
VNKDGGETIAQFAEELFEFVETSDAQTLVIDVRLNHGGNNFLVKPIIDKVIRSKKINNNGHLFVIIGRETFSACQNFCNRLQRETQVIFVGEPTGSKPNFVGEGNPIELPYSGVRVNGSSRYWQDSVSDDYRIWVAPDLVATMTSTDFRTNRDPAMSAILEYLEHREKNDARAGGSGTHREL